MPDRTPIGRAAFALAIWTAAAAGVLALLDLNPAWATMPALLVILAYGFLSASADKLEQRAAASWMKNQEISKATETREASKTGSFPAEVDELKRWAEEQRVQTTAKADDDPAAKTLADEETA